MRLMALRSAYHLADVAVDKALFAVRMHGYDPPAQSLPMQRTSGLVAAGLPVHYLLARRLARQGMLDAARRIFPPNSRSLSAVTPTPCGAATI
jgi:hypothetical protein